MTTVEPALAGELDRDAAALSAYELTVERPGGSDEVSVRCEADAGADADADALRARVHEALRERTGLRIDVELVPGGALPRSEGKAARVIDHRSG